MYNHTLKGGLRAGNFSMLASVDDIEVCAALCCEEKYCDLGKKILKFCFFISKQIIYANVQMNYYGFIHLTLLQCYICV